MGIEKVTFKSIDDVKFFLFRSQKESKKTFLETRNNTKKKETKQKHKNKNKSRANGKRAEEKKM
jgi:hypothetical protein